MECWNAQHNTIFSRICRRVKMFLVKPRTDDQVSFIDKFLHDLAIHRYGLGV
jgi:hypothetical protein